MSAYYNEIDEKAAAWLRELIKARLIADGEVDTRSIVDVRPGDLRGFRQCHFFAGIGGWSYALRLAGWPDDRPVWTGSCPCQPFSSAGKGRGTEDARHLWPQFRRLIRKRRPSVVFGEQVASKAGRVWLSAVFADAEALAYRAAGADLCAAGVGAPHIRQRLYFVLADLHPTRRGARRTSEAGNGRDTARLELAGLRAVGELADSLPAGRAEGWAIARRGSVAGGGSVGELAESDYDGRKRGSIHLLAGQSRSASTDTARNSEAGELAYSDMRQRKQSARGWAGSGEAQGWRSFGEFAGSSDASFWSECDWIPCRDGKARPVEPGSFPLAHGISARVGRLRGYGNAIVPQVAAAFIAAADECL
jgi:DNA (cytosine-5)-methyltransferase 1